MRSRKDLIGKQGESAAASYLQKKGYKILNRNYRVAGTEIDIIARTGDVLCFVEVKTRKSGDFGFPEEYVDERKKRKMINAAKIVAAKKPFRNLCIRFDIVAIVYTNQPPEIQHLEGVLEE